MYLYALMRGDEGDGDLCEVHFTSEKKLDWHKVVQRAVEALIVESETNLCEIETDEIVAEIEGRNPGVRSVVRDERSSCNIDLLDFVE